MFILKHYKMSTQKASSPQTPDGITNILILTKSQIFKYSSHYLTLRSMEFQVRKADELENNLVITHTDCLPRSPKKLS